MFVSSCTGRSLHDNCSTVVIHEPDTFWIIEEFPPKSEENVLVLVANSVWRYDGNFRQKYLFIKGFEIPGNSSPSPFSL